MKALLAKMTIDDLPKSLQKVAKQIGVSMTKELMVKCKGMFIYIPHKFTKIYCRRYIERHWEGNNADQLARDLGITERTVYRHLNAKVS